MKYLAEFKKIFKEDEIGASLIKTYGAMHALEIVDDQFTNKITKIAYNMFMQKSHFETSKPKILTHGELCKKKFLEQAIEKHGDKFDYTTIKFDGEYIEVYCNGHKDYIRSKRHNHINGGCRECYLAGRRYDINDLKMEMAYIWDNEYTYDEFTEFKSVSIPIPIICKYHGVFKLTPSEHKNSPIGCGQCFRDPEHKRRYIDMRKQAIERKQEWKEGKR